MPTNIIGVNSINHVMILEIWTLVLSPKIEFVLISWVKKIKQKPSLEFDKKVIFSGLFYLLRCDPDDGIMMMISYPFRSDPDDGIMMLISYPFRSDPDDAADQRMAVHVAI